VSTNLQFIDKSFYLEKRLGAFLQQRIQIRNHSIRENTAILLDIIHNLGFIPPQFSCPVSEIFRLNKPKKINNAQKYE
jgi:hypothetical protein